MSQMTRQGNPLNIAIASALLLVATACTPASRSLRDDMARELAFAADDLKYGRCEEFLGKLGITEPGPPQPYRLLRAILHLEGRCLEKSAAKSLALLRAQVADGPNDEIAQARLGWYLWEGIGTEPDRAAARRHFKIAADLVGPTLLGPSEEVSWQIPSGANEYWGLSERQYATGFVEPHTGSWALPEALLGELQEIEALGRGDGSGIMARAIEIKHGRNGHEPNPRAALGWLQTATAPPFDYRPGYFLMYQWQADYDRICRGEGEGEGKDDAVIAEPLSLSCSLAMGANLSLKFAANGGNLRAAEIISRCIEKAPDYPERNLAIYFWRSWRAKHGLPVPKEAIAAQELEGDQKWIMNEWNIAVDGVPFTLLGDTQC